MKVKSLKLKNGNSILNIVKGAFYALIVSLISILIFAFIIKFTSIGDGLIKPINQIIKILSIFVGCLFGLRKSDGKEAFKGLLIGVLYTLFAFLLFSALNGSFELGKSILIDLAFGMVLGLISAIICKIFKRG